MSFAAMAIPAAISAAGSIAGGYLAGKSSGQETKTEKTKRHLIDQLLASLGGEGPYSDLYKTDYDSFQKSFVDPAKSLFQNQIAPNIQQQYIASGQQRGTGLDDQLLRAGVDLDQLLNQHLMEYQQGGQNRTQNTISSILGGGSGGTQNMSSGQAFKQAGAGYLSSDSFSNSVADIFNNYSKNQTTRKGFEA